MLVLSPWSKKLPAQAAMYPAVKAVSTAPVKFPAFVRVRASFAMRRAVGEILAPAAERA